MQDISTYLNNVSIITYLAVFIGGVLTSFTPCVYPLIPIVVGVIGSSPQASRFRNFVLSLSYVLGMAIIFSTLGVLAALTGKLFGQVQSSPVAHIVVGNVIILFALALVDVIPLPAFLFARAGAGKVVKGGGAAAAFFMGVASGFVAAPCTAAVMGALLAYTATTQNVAAGFSLLFTFAIGLGMILILIGTFTGILASLPKSERLMGAIQKIFALLLVLLGEYYIFKAGMLNI